MLTIGCHVSIEGGYAEAAKRAISVGADTFQFFTKNPRGRGQGSLPDSSEMTEFYAVMKEGGLRVPLAHAPYTYNTCALKDEVREYTEESMRGELEFLEQIDGAAYNFHPGCHVGRGAAEGIELIASMLNRIMWRGMKTTVLLETMAGKGTEIGRNFEELRAIIDSVDESVRGSLGVCLDTCHVHDGGYPIASDPESVIAEFDRVIGLDRLRAIHLNDSKNVMGSAKDRHERWGQGEIGLDAAKALLTHPATRDLPFYLETPCDLDGYAEEIRLMRELAND